MFVCQDCGRVWDNEVIAFDRRRCRDEKFIIKYSNPKQARSNAQIHAKKFDHYVTGEIVKSYYFNI